MKKYFSCYAFLILYFSVSTGCNGDNDENNNRSKKDAQINSVMENSITGKWGGLGELTPVWDIRKDSIYYFQHSRTYAYKIIDKNMLINFGKSSTVLKDIHVKNDTLFFIDDAGLLIKGYRFK